MVGLASGVLPLWDVCMDTQLTMLTDATLETKLPERELKRLTTLLDRRMTEAGGDPELEMELEELAACVRTGAYLTEFFVFTAYHTVDDRLVLKEANFEGDPSEGEPVTTHFVYTEATQTWKDQGLVIELRDGCNIPGNELESALLKYEERKAMIVYRDTDEQVVAVPLDSVEWRTPFE